MADRPHVPKFGNWESQDDVPYTVYFDKARKTRPGTKMINPNDPQENPELFSNYGSPANAHAPPPRAKPEPEEQMVRRTKERVKSRDEGEFRQFPVSPARSENMNRRAAAEPTNQRYGGRGGNPPDVNRRPAAPVNPGYKSPYHSSSQGSNTPERTRQIPNVRGGERAAAIPKFGGWDEHEAGTAEGYTHIFDKVREEKHLAGRAGGTPGTPSRPINRQRSPPNSPKACCFPWSRK